MTGAVRIAEAVEEYLAYVKAEQSPGSVPSRRCELGRFVRWCEGHGIEEPSQVTRQVLERYQKHLYRVRKRNGHPLSRRSQAGLIAAVSALFTWLKRKGRVDANPVRDLELPRAEHMLPRHILSPEEVARVLDAVDTSTALGVRNRAILELLWSSALRRAEVCGVRVRDVEVERRTLFVKAGKGGHQRVVPVGGRALGWIERYRGEVRPAWAPDPDHGVLFVTAKGRPLSVGWLSRLCSRAIAAAGIDKPGAAHSFRHACATAMLNGGADIRMISELLGHQHLETTQVYTRVAIAKLQEVHDRTHPAKMPRRRRP